MARPSSLISAATANRCSGVMRRNASLWRSRAVADVSSGCIVGNCSVNALSRPRRATLPVIMRTMTAPARRPAITVLAIALLVAACAEQATPSPPATSSAAPSAPAAASATPTASPAPTPATPVPHRIAVRVVDGQGELHDRTTGTRFVPRGMNYIRLAGAHVTLNVGHYDPERIDAAFAEMARRGYNAVRIFLSTSAGGLPGPGSSLNPGFLDNAVDVLRRARAHGVYVLYTVDWLPESPGWSFASDPGIENVNGFYLSKGGVEASARFFRELAQGLVDRGAPLDALLAYELRNELYFTEIAPPFSLRSGSVQTANGTTYDVSTAAAKRQLLEDGLVFWIDRMREAIVGVDPTALVTVGFFQPKGPNESRIGDDRLIETRAAT